MQKRYFPVAAGSGGVTADAAQAWAGRGLRLALAGARSYRI